MPVIELVDVWRGFDGREVLRGLGLAVEPNETLSIFGGSGAGKSVLLRLIAGLIKPDRGSIRVLGEDIVLLDEGALVPVRRRMGFVFQGAALFDSLSVGENVAYPMREHTRWPEEEIRARVADRLTTVGLPGIEAYEPAALSGGMKKRVGIARALALAPEVVLYDEPTAGLDPANARMVSELILTLKQQGGRSAVVVTHDLPCAFMISDRVAVLAEGRIAAIGPPDEIRRSELQEVQDFLGGVRR
ncbi:MAG: ATP-binding cassette domain-containing protein [Deltaproteobacteria bacterium]|nr:ATP-binding cassette domain-containing protein [Deltaproteobacteria bacterium]